MTLQETLTKSGTVEAKALVEDDVDLDEENDTNDPPEML